MTGSTEQTTVDRNGELGGGLNDATRNQEFSVLRPLIMLLRHPWNARNQYPRFYL
jgi:hypothetical protein